MFTDWLGACDCLQKTQTCCHVAARCNSKIAADAFSSMGPRISRWRFPCLSLCFRIIILPLTLPYPLLHAGQADQAHASSIVLVQGMRASGACRWCMRDAYARMLPVLVSAVSCAPARPQPAAYHALVDGCSRNRRDHRSNRAHTSTAASRDRALPR